MSKVIVIGSQKGGVGKTTTTLNLAYSLCSMGKKVLAIDLDSQANLSTCYGIENTKDLEYTIGHLLMAQIEEEEPEELEHYIQSKDGVDFIPSSIYLSAVEAKLRTEMGAERMLAEVLAPIRDRYDYVLVDTAPSLGMLTVNALAAADEVVITVNPQLLAMMGLQDFLRTVGKIKKRINPKLTIAGILLTMCDGRTTLCTDNNIENIVKWFVERGEVEHTVHLASYDEIVRKNYNLSVSTYVEAADNREKIDIKKLNAEISEIVEREQLLRDEIEKIIAEIEG